MNYRPSKPFVWTLLVGTPLLAVLYFGLLPEVEALENPPIPGQIRFSKDRPAPKTTSAPSREGGSVRLALRGSLDWLEKGYEDLMSWEHNPWKSKRVTFGSHYFKLLESKNPHDLARAAELRRLGDALHRRILERWPELAVAEKPIPPERNGFLRWLELAERLKADPSRPEGMGLGMPDELSQSLGGNGPWNDAAARAWLAQERVLLDEVRTIGLMPERSVTGIDVDRFAFIPARLGKECAELLLLDARLAAEDGNAAVALESTRAALGLSEHFSAVETPTLLAATVQILIRQEVHAYALREVMPALPAGQLDPAAWESTLNPVVDPPAEFARLMKGEWNVTARQYLLPMLADTQDPKYPADPEALIDLHAGTLLRTVEAYSSTSPRDWPASVAPSIPDTAGLSRDSQDIVEILFVGARAWSKGMERSQSMTGLVQAAFSVMKGQPLPADPVYGLPYRWDPATRTLSAPDSPEFEELKLKPVIVPAP